MSSLVNRPPNLIDGNINPDRVISLYDNMMHTVKYDIICQIADADFDTCIEILRILEAKQEASNV